MHTTPDYTFEIHCVPHEDTIEATCFTADAVIRDSSGNEVRRIQGTVKHSYAEAAEDEAAAAVRDALRALRGEPAKHRR